MQRQFSISGFGKECYSYIINNTGRRLYQYTYENNFVESYNIFNAIESYPVVNGGDFQTLREAVKEDESTAIEFLYTDETTGEEREWFVANASIQESDWSVLLFVPADVLGASTNDLLNETLRSFVILSIIIIAIFILMMFVIIAGRADRKILREKEAANAKLEETVQRANDANAAKSEFLSRMSHDIRTPINAIIGMTGIALKHIDDKERVRDCLLKIDGSSQHLFSLINDVLDMSRIESGRTTMVKVAFNLSACVENCASIIEGQLATRDIELVREFEKMDNPYVLGDELHLHQVFINILGNAVKFTPDGGKIFFREKQIDIDGATGFRFEIEDTGIGMKEEYLPHLFEAFSQEDDGSRTTYKGTGLGMAIVKQFVEMMGGTVEVESALNIGTKVTIDMPMEIAEDSPEEEKYCRVRFDLRGMKVLLVDDNELNLEIAQELLEEQGIIVTTAEDGQEAIDVFKQSKLGDFDVILMDVMMPVMDGLVATKTIRAMKREDATKIPIIAMTANAYNEDVIKTAEAGMNAHLLKPIDVSKLYVTLASYYRGGGKVT
jgi:signal transduction histidine kinase/CheY-like chemotaxis protein